MVSEVIELSFGGGGKRVLELHCPSLCFTRKAGIRAKAGEGETTRPEGKVDRDEGGKRKNNEL